MSEFDNAGERLLYFFSKTLGVPLEVAHLIDGIHEGLPPEIALDWPERVVRAIQPGADTTDTWPRFVIWLLTEIIPSSEGEAVAKLYRRRIAGDEPSAEEWNVPTTDTRAGRAAEYAAWTAKTGWAAAEVAKTAGAWSQMADKLEEILASCTPA